MSNNKLNIGVINLMPDVEEYHHEVFDSFSALGDRVQLHGVKMKTKSYPESYQAFVEQNYLTLAQLSAKVSLDGLIITGAPVELLPFEDVNYWLELEQLIQTAVSQKMPTLSICWGALAVGKIYGIEKQNLDHKVFGVYLTEQSQDLADNSKHNPCMPFSIRACFEPQSIEQQLQAGKVRLLASHQGLAHAMVQSSDNLHIMCLGHPEYAGHRLLNEWQRDIKTNPDMPLPVGVDAADTTAYWRDYSCELFQFWLAQFNSHSTQKD